MNRVVFLADASCGELYGWLLNQPRKVAYGSLADAGMPPGIEYDLGLNFLGKRKIPPEELAKATWAINDRVVLTPLQERRIRALTCPPHKAHATINGRKYLITPED